MLEELKFASAKELLMRPINPPKFVVEGLVPNGVSVIAGDEKTGKSWMMLYMAICIADGKDFLGHKTTQSDVCYLCLEDTLPRLQNRLFYLTDAVEVGDVYLVPRAETLSEGLIFRLKELHMKKPSAKVFIIDTLQMIRDSDGDVSYAKDYADIASLRDFCAECGVSVFVVHHTRKQGDAQNKFNRFSGTKGITGAADTMFLLSKENEYTNKGTLSVKGRDIQYKELDIEFINCRWELIGEKTPEEIVRSHAPEIIFTLIDFLKERGSWNGSATELLDELGEESVAPNVLTKYVNQYRLSVLAEEGIEYKYGRTHADGRVLSFKVCDGCDGRDGEEEHSR